MGGPWKGWRDRAIVLHCALQFLGPAVVVLNPDPVSGCHHHRRPFPLRQYPQKSFKRKKSTAHAAMDIPGAGGATLPTRKRTGTTVPSGEIMLCTPCLLWLELLTISFLLYKATSGGRFESGLLGREGRAVILAPPNTEALVQTHLNPLIVYY